MENGGIIQGLDETTRKRIQDKAAALGRFQELYSLGRPKPIDRSVLENSRAVSGNFIDEVSQKRSELNGNPEKLLEALRNGEISRFSSRKTDELQEYLKEQGYLSDEEQLSKDGILVRMQAFISGKDVDKQELERMIDNVGTVSKNV